ncbi:MAG: hypothetical protein IJI57_07705 [Flexilinea sp.]|nr:hypothetical protein [Flexilinea sp.]
MIFRWIKEQFFPPKSERQLYEEAAWKNLRYSKSKEGKRQTEIEEEIQRIEENNIDEINPWSRPQ